MWTQQRCLSASREPPPALLGQRLPCNSCGMINSDGSLLYTRNDNPEEPVCVQESLTACLGSVLSTTGATPKLLTLDKPGVNPWR